MTVLTGARVVTADGVRDGGWVGVDGALITEVGTGPVPSGAREDLGGGWLVPGFLDLHVHGGGGYDFTSSADELLAGVRYHQSRGTTRTLASLMAGSLEAMSEQLSWIADLARKPDEHGVRVVGAHLEGPFLSSKRCGAQNGEHLISPDREVLVTLLEAGQGFVRTVTLAPELPGALDVIADLVQAGVVAAVGHTDADYDQAAAGFAAGASLTTHLFNAMSPVNHRKPGAVVAALESGAAFELINDGMHVHEAMISLVVRSGCGSLVLVTDAISATGVGDGEYSLGGLPVTVVDGKAVGTVSGSLAGSTLTMDEAFRRAVVEVGLSIEHASAAASGNPARVLGLADRCGRIAAGLDADLVHLDEEFRLRRVMVGGSWL